ncbi:zinc finger protein [Loa loa]|uniref:Zinc finger protein n=1 Tax=Loa loa TaxID=7209 RepID=A0A1S0TY66_LOALO|nr:zinc finger protein [Loa loa]EFO22050.1 zinc finger protein [Loa loa]
MSNRWIIITNNRLMEIWKKKMKRKKVMPKVSVTSVNGTVVEQLQVMRNFKKLLCNHNEYSSDASNTAIITTTIKQPLLQSHYYTWTKIINTDNLSLPFGRIFIQTILEQSLTKEVAGRLCQSLFHAIYLNTQEISHINMHFIYFVVVIFVQLRSANGTNKALDLSVQGLNDEQMGNLLLLAEVANKMPKAKIVAKNTNEFNGQNLTVKMKLTVKEENVKQKSTERLAGRKSEKRNCSVEYVDRSR